MANPVYRRGLGSIDSNVWKQHYRRFFVRPLEDIVQSTGTVYDMPYTTCEPIGGDWWAMEAWCTETFGATGVNGVWEPDERWYANNRKFWFRDESDAIMFMLRWGR